MMDSIIPILGLVAVAFILAGIFFFALFLQSGHKQLDKRKYQTNWIKIENSLKKDNETSFAMSVLNADKIVDRALKEKGFRGKTMGERMKYAEKSFSNINAVWAAHKLRNRIAHETDIRLDYDGSKRALASFKQALKDLGAI